MSIKSVVCGVAALFALTTAPAMAKDALRFGVEGSYPPFSRTEASGEVTGYDIDIANALCAEMNVQCEMVKTRWDDLLTGLAEKRYDAVLASMSITAERLKIVDFTNPYYSTKVQFIAAKSMKFDLAQLDGLPIGALVNSVSAAWLKQQAPQADIRLYPTQEEIYPDLVSGALNAVLADNFVQWEWLMTASGKDFEFKGKPVYDDDKIAIAVAKGNKELVDRLNRALQAIRENGEYQAITDRYFPFDIN